MKLSGGHHTHALMSRHTPTHEHMYRYIHEHTHMNTHRQTHTHISIYTFTYTDLHAHTHSHTHTRACSHTHMCTYMLGTEGSSSDLARGGKRREAKIQKEAGGRTWSVSTDRYVKCGQRKEHLT